MKYLILTLLMINISGCSVNDDNNNVPYNTVLNLTFSPGVYNASNSGTVCSTNQADETQVLATYSPTNDGSYDNKDTALGSTNDDPQTDGVLYHGNFTNTNHDPCFTGTMTSSSFTNPHCIDGNNGNICTQILTGCANARDGEITFTNCQYIDNGNSFTFNANYQIKKNDTEVLRGTVSGISG